MPIYEYACENCGALTEFIEGISGDAAEKTCGRCGSDRLKRALSRGVTPRMDGMIADRGGKTCCGRDDRCGKPPCSEPGSCCGQASKT